MTDVLGTAIEYGARGWRCFPLRGKVPITPHGFQDASDDPARLAELFGGLNGSVGVGIATGSRSNLVVLDVDDAHGGAGTLKDLEARNGSVPRTFTVLTGGGGRHFYFLYPLLGPEIRNSAGKLGPGLDIRAEGGYVVAPPSPHESGRPYKLIHDRPPAELPDWLLALLTGERGAGERAAAAAIPDLIPSGKRNETLASLAGSMRRRGATEAEMLAALRVANAERCRPPLPEAELAQIAHSISAYPPTPPVPPIVAKARERAEPELDRFQLESVEWGPILESGVPQLEYLSEPDLPKRKRIWGVGAGESGKSIWAEWQACKLTRAGYVVVYVSQENGLEEDVRRFMRLRPDFERLRLYVDQGLDLTTRGHADALIEAAQGAALVALDTLSACWTGDEDSNSAIAALDREALQPIVHETGASVLVLDHTGNPQPFARRRGVSAPRGASAKGQKADFLLEFRAGGDSEFTIEHGKARGTRKQPKRTFQVIDTDDGGLDVIEVESDPNVKAAAIANALVPAVVEAGFMTTGQLRKAMTALGAGTDLQRVTMELLEAEDPPRLTVDWETIDTGKGRQRAKVWRPAEESARGYRGGTEALLVPPETAGQGGTDEGVPIEVPLVPPGTVSALDDGQGVLGDDHPSLHRDRREPLPDGPCPDCGSLYCPAPGSPRCLEKQEEQGA